MKLKTVSTYQSVRFGLKDEKHFDVRNPRFVQIEMEHDARLGAVRIAMPGCDTIYVFNTNLAYIVPEDVVETPVKAKAAK